MRRVALPLLFLLLAAPGCAGLREALVPPQGQPGDRPGWLAWRVGDLRFQAPEGWRASASGRRLVLDGGGAARLEAWVIEESFPDAKACLAAAEEALARAESQLVRARRHPTKLGGEPAVMQEADSGGWHGWAYAVCPGGRQHRLFFAGRSPVTAEVLEAWQEIARGIKVGGGP